MFHMFYNRECSVFAVKFNPRVMFQCMWIKDAARINHQIDWRCRRNFIKSSLTLRKMPLASHSGRKMPMTLAKMMKMNASTT